MKIQLNEKGVIEIKLADLLYEVEQEIPVDEKFKLIESFCWMEDIFKRISEMLTHEFSREHYNKMIHVEREKFLAAIQHEEIKYYADKLACLIEGRFRNDRDYWNLWHFYHERPKNLNEQWREPEKNPSDIKLKDELSAMIEVAFKEGKTS